MDTNRYQVRIEKDIDPTQHTVWDTVDNVPVVRYAEKSRAEQVCENLNAKLK